MPIPTRRNGEKRADFVDRFMSNAAMKKEFPSKKQRLAVAFSKARKGK